MNELEHGVGKGPSFVSVRERDLDRDFLAVEVRVNRGQPEKPSPLCFRAKTDAMVVEESFEVSFFHHTGEAEFERNRLAGLSSNFLKHLLDMRIALPRAFRLWP
ncbi:MAG: hypothetical protein QG640_691 [Patescibacteria group bacterium]|nr:hypothetical protein [Patescibacteria group bacterium]